MHGHFYGNFTGNLAHAQSVCTRPFSRGEGPGDEAIISAYFLLSAYFRTAQIGYAIKNINIGEFTQLSSQ